MKKQAESWLKAAEDDLLVIEKIINNKDLTHMVAFHSQQSIEKSMKAILEEMGCDVPRIHNIIKLKGEIEDYFHLDIDNEIFMQINELYIDSRYPTEIGLLPDGKPTRTVASQFYNLAQAVYQKVKYFLQKQD